MVLNKIIDDIHVSYDERIEEHQIQQIIAEERIDWLAKGKTLGRVDLHIIDGEIEVTAHERSPIRRIRRITGYLSYEDRFNPSKQEELHDRVNHL
jgi:anaerobic ribonucleoside-triphosphate reductase activating protein